jgi:hypothetical protein
MFAEAARRLIIVDGVDDFADDSKTLESARGTGTQRLSAAELIRKAKWALINTPHREVLQPPL